jgi:Carboxypeptidase regulatory-like domain/TonB-dependent Receptor Plug Domain
MRSRLSLLCTLFSILLLATAAFSQTSASMVGSVKDPTGAAVVGAEITVTDSEHGITRNTTSNGDGEWAVPALSPGTYDLAVVAPGFKKYEANGVILRVAQKARIDVPLVVGATTTEMTVEGSAVAQVETQSSELSGVVTGKEINQLQLNGRNFTQLVTLVPGVTNQSGQDEGTVGVSGNVAYSINGGRTEYNNWELDGGDNLDNGSNTSMNVYPSLEAIAEFKVLTSNYGAQYGRNGSGTVEVETKSGTKEFHGSAYEFLRNDAFNANNYFNFGNPVPEYKKHDFGYTVGGPVYIPGLYNKSRDKTFFFWSQEWRRERVPAATNLTQVPTTAERAGNFSDVCPDSTGSMANCPLEPATLNGQVNPLAGQPFPNNQVPIDTAHGADALEKLIPAPTSEANGVGQWQAFPISPTTWREELIRVDHNFNSNWRGMFRYIHDSWSTIYPNPLWTGGTSFPTLQTNFNGPSVGMVARLTATLSPTLLNEFVASYTTDHINLVLVGPWQRPANMTFGLFSNGGGGKIAGISLANGPFGGIGEDPGYIPNGPLNSNPTYTYRDNVTKIIGTHNLQFGAYFTAAQKNEIPQPGISTNGQLTFDSSNSAVSTGNSFADLLIGNISQFQQQKSVIKTYNRYKIFEPYFQDDWHATSRLTLNLGLRLSLFGTQRERYHNAWNWEPSAYVPGASNLNPDGTLVTGANQFNGWVQCGVGKTPAGCTNGHLFNPAPRIGFAFDPKGDGKWALRGGYGVFFEHMNANEAGTGALEPQNPATLTTSVTSIAGYANLVPQTGTTATPLSVISIPNQMHWPYVQQWHLDLQHSFLKNTVLTLGYVGSKGTHLSRQYDLNQILPVSPSQNPYGLHEPMGVGTPLSPAPTECGSGQKNDAYGVPTDGTTPSGVPLPKANPGVLSPAVNAAIAVCGVNPNPFRPRLGVGGIKRQDQTAASVYHGLQVNLRQAVGSLLFNLSYTYSHSIDDASSGSDLTFPNTYNLEGYRASSNFDQRHSFTLSYVYDLPFFKSPGLIHKVLGGWQWSGITLIQTGSPFTVTNGGGNGVASDNAGVANSVAANGVSSLPDQVGDPNVGIGSVPRTGPAPFFYNPNAFVAPRGLTFGSTNRNSLSNPRRTNFDMALFKHFAVTERVGFEFRAEAFNIFNHTEFAWLGGGAGSAGGNSPFSSPTNSAKCYAGSTFTPGDVTCSAPFLTPTSAHNPRILQLGAKFIF